MKARLRDRPTEKVTRFFGNAALLILVVVFSIPAVIIIARYLDR